MVQVRLEAIPEMNYSPMDNPPRGEVLVKVSKQAERCLWARGTPCRYCSIHWRDLG